MRFVIQFSAPVEFARFRDVAASPLFHSDKVFERSAGEQWLETTENLYRLLLSQEGFVIGAVTRRKPCSEFCDLIAAFGLTAQIDKVYEEGEEPRPDWESISERYPTQSDDSMSERGLELAPDLRPIEEEVLRAIQLFAGSSNNPVDVGLFANGFSANLPMTLRSLTRKGCIAFSEQENAVKLL